jgi:hypothetical protein
MSCQEIEAVVSQAEKQDEFLGIRIPVTDENDDQPWAAPPSRRAKEIPIVGPLPEKMELVLGNQVYVPKAGITP